MQEPWRTARAVSYDLSALPGHPTPMNTVIKILAFLIKAHQRVINKLAAKLAVPQLLRKPSTKAKSKPTITNKKS